MKTISCRFLCGVSFAAVAVMSFSASSAIAQNASSGGPADVETVTVTGSRISIQGYEAPSPVTVIGQEQLDRDAPLNIVDSITKLPSVGVSETPNNGDLTGDLSQGDAALSVINLRNLGIARTLVLFDGQRVVSSNIYGGGVDLSTIPSELVKRIDIVTGGASAAYGSDAVAGVVNLVLDKEFVGFKANLEVGEGAPIDHPQIKAAASWGADYDGGRGHFILSADHTWSNTPVFNNQAPGYDNSAIVPNPAATSTNGLPYYISVRNTGQGQYTQGGLIRGNTAAGPGGTATANSLSGLQFVGAGSPTAFNFGTVSSTNPNVCYNGCTGNAANQPYTQELLAVPYHNSTFFAYNSYQITPDIKASVQLNYGLFADHSDGGTRTSTVAIAADNAYLPASISSKFGTLSNGYNTATGLGGTSAVPTQNITVGTINTNNLNLNSFNLNQICQTVGVPCITTNRALERAVFTLEGKLGGDWSWNVYAQHGQVRERQVAAQDSYTPRYNNAIDAVVVTPTNQGVSGLPLGSIQCRALLSAATAAAASGCQPLDILGNNVASPQAITYVNPGQDPSSGILNQELISLNQDVFSGSMQGVLPLGLPAGQIAAAFGGEYRHEQGNQSQVDPNGALGYWAAGNFRPYRGQYEVQEGFLELNAPILKNQYVDDLNFNAAGRITNYSTSGLVETWKLGATSQVTQDVKLRGTWSLDIRAPLISDLYSPGILAVSQYQYPLGSPSYQTITAQGGNPALQPEKAVTTSFGVVLTPRWVEGLSLSADWYTINIHGGIFSTDGQTIINRCLGGETSYCSALLFSASQNGGTKPYQVNQLPYNAADVMTSGLDFQADYVTEFLAGTLSTSLLGNYTDEQTQTAVGITYDSAGSVGGPLAYASSGLPKARATLSTTYTEGPWSGTVQGRFWGGAQFTNGVENLPANVVRASISPTGVLTTGVGNGNLMDNNHVNPVGYLDLRLSYKWNDNLELYSAVDDVTNVPKPDNTSNSVYDILGRVFRVGVRFAN